MITEQFQPVRLVPLLGFGQSQQDVVLLACSAPGQLAVARSLGAFVGEVLPPAPDLPGRMGRGRAHLHIMATRWGSESVVSWARPVSVSACHR